MIFFLVFRSDLIQTSAVFGVSHCIRDVSAMILGKKTSLTSLIFYTYFCKKYLLIFWWKKRAGKTCWMGLESCLVSQLRKICVAGRVR